MAFLFYNRILVPPPHSSGIGISYFISKTAQKMQIPSLRATSRVCPAPAPRAPPWIPPASLPGEPGSPQWLSGARRDFLGSQQKEQDPPTATPGSSIPSPQRSKLPLPFISPSFLGFSAAGRAGFSPTQSPREALLLSWIHFSSQIINPEVTAAFPKPALIAWNLQIEMFKETQGAH